MTKKALEGQNNFVKCKCGNMIEVLAGNVNYDVRNELGKVINKTAAKHMS